MNPIPDDDEINEFESFLHVLFDMGILRDSRAKEIFPEESELERLDRKYAPLFERLEKG